MSKYYKVELLAEAMKPKLVNGSWRKPALSGRQRARIRQEALRNGTIGGKPMQWNPEWDNSQRSWIQPIPKGTAQERSLLERVQNIDNNMKNMPKYIEEARKEASKDRQQFAFGVVPIKGLQSKRKCYVAPKVKVEEKTQKQQPTKQKKQKIE
ncbi:hypothetical protein WA158_003564 [Blastocystis sp. Blastoise]